MPRPRGGASPRISRLPERSFGGVLVYSWLYGLVAGVCYAIRAHLRLRAETLLSARAEAAASHAQLRALRAQLNPHFLFNALHSLGATRSMTAPTRRCCSPTNWPSPAATSP